MASGELKRGDGLLLRRAISCEVVFDRAQLDRLRKKSQQHYDDMLAKMEVGPACAPHADSKVQIR